MTAPSRGYRRLAGVTLVSTFALVIVGGVVRVSDSGLGCGPEGSGFSGWPFCNGDLVPGLDLNSVIEYTHRILAAAVGLMILAMAVQALRRYRANRGLVWSSVAALVLVIAQGALGGATVEEGLDETLVAAHLGLAMLLLALLIYALRASRPDVPGADPADGGPRFRLLSGLTSGFLLATILAGGYMAGTQNYGRPDYELGDGAHHACGKEFPSCNGDFMPFGEARLVDIHLTHRFFMYLATLLVIALVIVALRRRPSAGVVVHARALAVFLVVQLVLGALNVWLDEYEILIVAHLALGTLLWATAVTLTFQLYRVPALTSAASPRTRAVTA